MEANPNISNKQLQYSLRSQYPGVKASVVEPHRLSQPPIQPSSRKSLYSSSLFHDDRGLDRKSVAIGKREREIDTISVREGGVRRESAQRGGAVKKKESQSGTEKVVGYDYNEQLMRLKIEEMTFKFKTKVGSLLKQMDISVQQLDRFTAFSRIDQILDFLAEKVRGRLLTRQISQASSDRARDKQRELLGEYEAQIEAMRIKKADKEGIQKGYKTKLKEAHNEIRQLYDRINIKQRQLSVKITEIYQIKSVGKESEKLIQTYKQKCLILQKQNKDLNQKKGQWANKLIANIKLIEEQNTELKDKIQDLNQLAQQHQSKQIQILQLNHQLNEELQRWRERFQSQQDSRLQPALSSQEIVKDKSNQNSDNRPLKGRLSILSLQSQNQRLSYRIKQLEKQNRQLSRDLEGYLSLKQKYEGLISSMNSSHEPSQTTIYPDSLSQPSFSPSPLSLGQKWKSLLGESSCFQIQIFYRKQIETIIQQWRDKLYEIVGKYEQDQQNNRRSNEQLEAKLYQLANQKYLIENKLIEKERELYELDRISKSRGSGRKINNGQTESQSETVTGNGRKGSESMSQNGISK